MRLTTTLLYTLKLFLFSVALTQPPPLLNVLKPPTLGAPDILTLHSTPTNQMDVTWANIPLRFAYTLVSSTGSPGVWETKQAIFAMGGLKNDSVGLIWTLGSVRQWTSPGLSPRTAC
jgi:hypothetical protein